MRTVSLPLSGRSSEPGVPRVRGAGEGARDGVRLVLALDEHEHLGGGVDDAGS